jgi:hypothetical protein
VLTVAFAFYLVATVLLRRRPKRLSDLVADGHGRA